jgi:hypothetical protein
MNVIRSLGHLGLGAKNLIRFPGKASDPDSRPAERRPHGSRQLPFPLGSRTDALQPVRREFSRLKLSTDSKTYS